MKIIKLNIMILLIILFSLSIFPVHTYGLFDDGKQSSEINKKEEIMNKIENVYYKYRTVINFSFGLLSCINFVFFILETIKKHFNSDKKYIIKQLIFFSLSILFLFLYINTMIWYDINI